MKVWFLVIIMGFEIGPAREPVYFVGTKGWDSYDTCMKVGEIGAEWLTQDFVRLKVECYEKEELEQLIEEENQGTRRDS